GCAPGPPRRGRAAACPGCTPVARTARRSSVPPPRPRTAGAPRGSARRERRGAPPTRRSPERPTQGYTPRRDGSAWNGPGARSERGRHASSMRPRTCACRPTNPAGFDRPPPAGRFDTPVFPRARRWCEDGRTMRGLRRLAAVLAVGAAGSLEGGGAHADSKEIVQLDLKGVVDPFMADYVTGGIQSAIDGGDTAVLVTIDTPGGLDSSMRKITEAILNSPVPVITY